MIEDELRAAFARQEGNIPELGALRAGITRAAVGRRRRRALSMAAVAVFVIMVGVSAPIALDRAARIGPITPPGASASEAASRGMPAGPLNVLLMTRDEAGSPTTVMVAHVPTGHDHAYLVSVPLSTSETWLRFDLTVEIPLQAVRLAVDSMGGLRACLPGRGGCREFDGAAVADVLRSPGAERDAQRLVMAMLRKSATYPVPLPLSAAVKLLRQGGDLAGEVGRWVRELDPSNVVGLVNPGSGTMDHVQAALMQDAMAAFTLAHPEWVTEIQR